MTRIGYVGLLLFLLNLMKFCKANMVLQQKEYKLDIHHGSVEYCDSSYFKYFNLTNTKFNRTTRTLGVQLQNLFVLDNTYMVTIQAYKFINNEYKRFAPIRVTIPVCDAFEKNIAGLADLCKSRGIPAKCPIAKGKYKLDNIVLDGTKLPPKIPAGDYKMDIHLFSGSLDILLLAWHGTIIY